MNLDKEALLNELEVAYEEEGKALALKSQAKVIMDGVKDRLDDFAGDIEAEKKIIHEAYARFKKLKTKKMKATDDDYYAVIEAVDEHFIEEEDVPTDTE